MLKNTHQDHQSVTANEKLNSFRVAAIQMASGPSVTANLEEAARWIEEAVSQQAKLVVLPEYFCIMGLKDTDKLAVGEQPGEGPIQKFLSDTTKRHKIWLVGGSVPLATSDPGKVYNSCLVYADNGELAARYDKIHLFGLQLGNERYAEEKTIKAGDKVVTVDSPFGRMGLSIRYDLRWKRRGAKRGWRFVTICVFLNYSAAWTKSTSFWRRLHLLRLPEKRIGKCWCARAPLKTWRMLSPQDKGVIT